MQRLLDILLSGLALLVLSPVMVPIALILRATGEGEIFFLQERIGRDGRVFRLYKFATMLKNSPSSGTVTMKDDPRILPAGKFLRKTKINELPQLLNILRGDMSIVGPRPMTRQTFAAYPPSTQSAIVQVRPGLSGVGSIIFRAEEDILSGAAGSIAYYERTIAPYKGAIEEWYIENTGLLMYLKVIAVTALVVLFPHSRLAWQAFPGLPPPPDELRAPLRYPAAA
jgi:lipopolysaccharide/colanic/teichoic acid biosynthesis glycosyltransferase